MGELVSERADLSLAALTLTPAREPYIAATVPFSDAGYALLVRVHRARTTYSFLSPFK